jgi:general secretion pathway protein I
MRERVRNVFATRGFTPLLSEFIGPKGMSRRKKRLLDSRRNVFATTGFTLIEVVVAMAILAIGLTIIIELFSGGLRLGRTSVEYTKAVNYARMKMEEVFLKQTIEEGSEEGTFDDTYRWQIDVKRVDVLQAENRSDFKPPAELFQVKINILWKSGAKERSTRIESFRTIRLEDGEKKS